jgi:hypothetical protein
LNVNRSPLAAGAQVVEAGSFIANRVRHEEQTRAKALVAQLLLAAVWGGAITTIMAGAAWLLGLDLPNVASGLIIKIMDVGDNAHVRGGGALWVIEHAPEFVIFAIATGVAFVPCRDAALEVARTAWSSYRDDIFERIARHPSAIDPSRVAPDLLRLPDSNADQVFTALCNFALRGAHDRVRLWFPFNGAHTLFAWTVVTGQPGAGKTRLVVEAARELGKSREIEELGLWPRLVRSWLAWVFEEAPGLRRKANDPWDVGYLRKTEGAIEALKTWKPRKPTLLILDDPGPGVAAEVIALLISASPNYRKPVRLVFVNQALPSDLKLRWADGQPEGSEFAGFALPPPVVNQGEMLTDHRSMRGFVAALLQDRPEAKTAPVWKVLKRDDDFTALAKATAGNPLLAELAVDLIGQGKYLSDLPDERSILTARAITVIESLNRAGFAHKDARRALAVATLADGPEWEAWSAALGAEDIPEPKQMLDAFPHSPEASNLSAWVIAEATGAAVRPKMNAPPIRPDLIGDRVLDLWVERSGVDAGEKLAKDYVERAWRAGPGALRSMQRRSGQTDILARALRAEPDSSVFPSRLSYASAMTDSALQSGGLAEFAERAIDCLSTEELESISPMIRSAVEAPGARTESAAPIVSRYIERRQSLSPVGFDDLIELVTKVFETRGQAGNADALGDALAAAWLKEAIDWRRDEQARRKVRLLNDQAQNHGPAGARAISKVLAVVGNPGDDLAPRLDLAAVYQQLTYTYATIPLGAEAQAAVATAAKVDDLAAPFPDEQAIQFFKIAARSNVAYAWSELPAGAGAAMATEAAEQVDEIAGAFLNELMFQEMQARVWQNVAHAHSEVAVGAGAILAAEAADRVDRVALAFPEERLMLEMRLRARGSVAYATSEIPAGAGAADTLKAAQQVDELAQRLPAELFLQELRAIAWLNVAYAQGKIPSGAAAAAAATKVDAIAAPFPTEISFQAARAKAWQNVVHAHAKVAAGEGEVFATTAAERVDEIAAPFPHEAEVQEMRAKAWQNVSFARSQIPHGAAAAQTMEAAKQVDDIALLFPGAQPFQELRARAWQNVAVARCHVPAGAAATQALEAAETVDAIALPFPNAPLLQEMRARAWQNVAFGRSEIPFGAAAAGTKEAAESVDRIAMPFPKELVFQEMRALAWQNLAYTNSLSPERAPHASKAAALVDEIASGFPDDAKGFQEVRARAWRHVARAWGQVSSSEGKMRAQEAVDRVNDLATRFPDNAVIQEMAVGARAHQ